MRVLPPSRPSISPGEKCARSSRTCMRRILSSGGGPDGAGSGANDGAGEAASAGSKPGDGEEPFVPYPAVPMPGEGVPRPGEAAGFAAGANGVAATDGVEVDGGGSCEGREQASEPATRHKV